MKKLIQFTVTNPVTILMMVLAILLLGKISYDKLSVDLLPNLNNPRLYIEMKTSERPPEEIEKQFVEGMESMAIRQRDVAMVSSVTKAGSARITVEYAWNKDMDEAFLDLQKAMNSYIQNEDIIELKISQNDPNTDPIVLLALSHNSITDMAEMRKIAENYVRNEITRVEGIADVTLSGAETTNMIVETDPYKLNAFGLNLSTLSSKIEENNQRIAGGRVSEMGMQYIVSGVNVLSSEADFENIIVGYKNVATDGQSEAATGSMVDFQAKAPIYLKDVATVRFENNDPENIVRINGERCLGLSVYKEMRYNTVRAVDGLMTTLDKLERALPGYHFEVVSNQGTFINSAIGEVQDSALMGILLAIIILFVFLRRLGTTLIVSLAIPISIVATFNLMYFNNLTLNIMTLGGLALGAGMLVDNAIVVIESIFRNQEKGMSVKDAVVTGTSEVGAAVTSSTLTTIVVFLPIVYLHGASGELFKDQAWTVTFSLISSLFVALFVIPMLYNQIFGGKREAKSRAKVKASVQIGSYGRFLGNVLRYKWLVILLSGVLIGATYMILPFVGTEFMPKADSRALKVDVRMPEGTHLERTASTIQSLEDMIFSLTGDSLAMVFSHVGPGSGGSGNSFLQGDNTANIKIILDPAAPITPDQLVERLVAYTENIEGMEVTFAEDGNTINSLMGTEGAPLVVEVKGEELDELSDITRQVQQRLQTINGLFNIVSSVENGAPEIQINIDRTVAGLNNINVSTVVTQIKEQLDGKTAGQMDYRGEMRDIVVTVPNATLSQLENMSIKNGEKEYRLVEIADLSTTTAPKEIYRRNQTRINRVMANIEDGVSLDKAAKEIMVAVSDIALPTNYSISVTGAEEKRKESMDSLMFALMLSVVLVYMVMASQFESLLHPFTILLTIPLAVVGAILLFFITGTTINIMGVIGMVMLVGIAVNNSIILVDRINQLKLETDTLKEAIIIAGSQRIRPILMTSLTTILALLPMTFAFGDGASLRAPMAIAVIGGLITSTILSLIVIPCVYDVFERMKRSIQRRKTNQ